MNMRSIVASVALAVALTACGPGDLGPEEARDLEKHAQHNLLQLTNTHDVILHLDVDLPEEAEEGAYYPFNDDRSSGYFVLYQGKELPQNGQFEQMDGRVYRFQR